MPRILLLDDDDAVRESMARMLRTAGYTVQSARTGEEGLGLAKEGAFDVILSDMRMPGLSGLDVLRKLRDSRVDSVLIMMTGFGTVETAVEAMKLGAVDFVQKILRVSAALLRTAFIDFPPAVPVRSPDWTESDRPPGEAVASRTPRAVGRA